MEEKRAEVRGRPHNSPHLATFPTTVGFSEKGFRPEDENSKTRAVESQQNVSKATTKTPRFILKSLHSLT